MMFGSLALAVGLLAAAPTHATELQKVRVSIIPIIDVAPLMAASQQGFFAEEGLEIDTTPTQGGAAGIPGVIGGSVDITFGNVVSTMLAAHRGLDVTIIAPATRMEDVPTVAVLVGRKGDAYKAPEDFNGKVIGVNTRGGINWLYARAWVKARGGDPEKVSYKEVPFPQLEDAIKRDQIDAGFVGEPFKGAMLKDPALAVVGIPFLEVQPGLDVGQYITSKAYAEKNPETVQKFVRALRKGITWYNSNLDKPEVAALVASYTKLPLATVQSLKLTPLPSVANPEQIQKTVELMRAHGMIEGELDADKFIHPIATKE